MSWQNDLQTSMAYVMRHADVVNEVLKGRLIQVENIDNDVCKTLDLECGTDYLIARKESGVVWGIASRVQYGNNYRSFTIRKERKSRVRTEFEKRKIAIKSGGFYPYLTMQMYVVNGDLDGIGVARTIDVIEFIDKGLAGTRTVFNDGEADFYVCYWDKMRGAGCRVREWRKGQGVFG